MSDYSGVIRHSQWNEFLLVIVLTLIIYGVMETLEINLDLPPEERWLFVGNYKDELEELISCYWREIEDFKYMFDQVAEYYKKAFISDEYIKEIECLSSFCKYSPDEILFANLYYDIIKFAFGCTAFASNYQGSVLHSRNLDWWTENDILSKYSKIFDFKKNGKTVFKSVGWIGFVGVLSGMKPNSFSLTLNAILSEDEPSIARPITFLNRDVLQGDFNYDSAVKLLSETEIVCDCLLLVSGVEENQFCVIERTPKRNQIRKASEFIVVANDYKLIDPDDSKLDALNSNILRDTSCKRYETVEGLLNSKLPQSNIECFRILDHSDVKMNITVQQMVFNTKENKIFLK